jgi:hypothetical protein
MSCRFVRRLGQLSEQLIGKLKLRHYLKLGHYPTTTTPAVQRIRGGRALAHRELRNAERSAS